MRTLLIGLAVGLLAFGVTVPTLAQDAEVVFWQSISESTDGAEFCAYLEAYPKGKFAPLAKLRAKKLGATCGQAAAQPSAPAPKKVTQPAPAPKKVTQPAPTAAPAPKFDGPQEMLRTKGGIREVFKAATGGVAIKWEDGHCTRLQGDGTERSVTFKGGISTANDFFDSNGNVGVWGVKDRGISANFCYRFSTSNDWECRKLKMEGQIVHLHPPTSFGPRMFSGVVLPPEEYESCPNMSFNALAQASRGGEPVTVSAPKPAPKPAAKTPTSPFAMTAMTGMKGWLETPEEIFKAFRLNEGGVAIKWTGGYCTMIQGANTAKPIKDLERANTAYDLFDSNGSVGIWTARPKHETGLVPANLCIKFSAWSEWDCDRIKMDGQNFELYGAGLTSDLEWTGIILPPSQYKQCQEKSYDEIATELRRMRLAASGISVTSGPDVEPLDQIMFALKAANVRGAPSTSGAKLFVMGKGEQVQVTGKVSGQNWYQIKLGGGDKGYIFGTLLGDQRPGGQTFANASENQQASAPADTQAAPEDDGWTTFALELDMFPDSYWEGKDGDCDVSLTFEPFENEPQYTWVKNCNGNIETETLVYGLSPGAPWLNLPTEASFVDLCSLRGNENGAVKIIGCKYKGEYTNSDRAPMIVAAVEQYKADAPKREAERKASEERNKKFQEEKARKEAALAKTSYGKRLKSLEDRKFGQAPVPPGGQGIVVCSKHYRLYRGDTQAGRFPDGQVLNFNSSRMAEMEAELKAFGVPEFTLGKAPWIDRDSYTLFNVFDGIIFYDRNIERRPHPAGEGTWVIGEMRNAQIENYVRDAGPEIKCEVMLERKTCADPKDKKGNFSMPCG